MDKITVTLDSLPPFCGTSHPPALLHGSPSGGLFSGDGIVGNTFDPGQAGEGQHRIVYTVTGADACHSGQAIRLVNIMSLPQATVPPVIKITPGASVQLPQTPQPGNRYSWSPPAFLSDPAVSNPIATPIDSISYHLVITDPAGCSIATMVKVLIVYSLWIPTAFTPNGDGVNDTWAIKGVEFYPPLVI